jgi:hypothetical protein
MSDCEWNEFRVIFTRAWADEKMRGLRPGERSFRPNWGIEVDADGKAYVDVSTAINGWREFVLAEILRAGMSFAEDTDTSLEVGPFITDEVSLEMRTIGGGISLIVAGRIVLRAQEREEAEALLVKYTERAKVPGRVEVLSDLETLAAEAKGGA